MGRFYTESHRQLRKQYLPGLERELEQAQKANDSERAAAILTEIRRTKLHLGDDVETTQRVAPAQRKRGERG